MKEPYQWAAPFYDLLFESAVRNIRMAGIRMFRPSSGMKILDVGCGTGAHLSLYLDCRCQLYGLDLSSAMLSRAQKRLGEGAQLTLGDATSMPYEDGQFDLVITMLFLHELSMETRQQVLGEMGRVVKGGGGLLLIDFHPGPYRGWMGRAARAVIFLAERSAGGEHFRNSRTFLAAGGLPGLTLPGGLVAEKRMILAGGAFANLLLRKE